MNNFNKQELEKCIRDVLNQKRIPGEDCIRQIVREEIKGYHEKEENELKKPISGKFNVYFQEKKYKSIVWYILMFFCLFFDVLGFKLLTDFSQQCKDNYANINVIVVLIFILLVLILYFFVLISMKVYDRMLEKNYKNAKLICLLELVYLCKIAFPDISTWIEKLINLS